MRRRIALMTLAGLLLAGSAEACGHRKARGGCKGGKAGGGMMRGHKHRGGGRYVAYDGSNFSTQPMGQAYGAQQAYGTQQGYATGYDAHYGPANGGGYAPAGMAPGYSPSMMPPAPAVPGGGMTAPPMMGQG